MLLPLSIGDGESMMFDSASRNDLEPSGSSAAKTTALEASANESSAQESTPLKRALAGEAFLLFDGGMGTMIQKSGVSMPEEGVPDLLNLTDPEVITKIHRAYVLAGAQVITTNTFNSSPLKLKGEADAASLFAAAVSCARAAGAPYVAADIGPMDGMLEPLGPITLEEAYAQFAEQVEAAEEAGADLILIETMSDLLEVKTAVLAAKERSSLPVIATMTFGEGERTFLGVTPESAAATLSALGVDAVGINCSLGPDRLISTVKRIASVVDCPIIAQPNAGLPRVEGGRTVYDVSAEEFAQSMNGLIEAGASLLGGCCGTEPDHIAALAASLTGKVPGLQASTRLCLAASAQNALSLPRTASTGAPLIIGGAIDAFENPRINAAVLEGDTDQIMDEAMDQQDEEVDALAFSIGTPEAEEAEFLGVAITEVQGTVALPFMIRTEDSSAIEAASRSYAGKLLICISAHTLESDQTLLASAARMGCALAISQPREEGIAGEELISRVESVLRYADEQGMSSRGMALDFTLPSSKVTIDQVFDTLSAMIAAKVVSGLPLIATAPDGCLASLAHLLSDDPRGLDLMRARPFDALVINPLEEEAQRIIEALGTVAQNL